MSSHKKSARGTRVSTSWERVADWYSGWVGEEGSRHHQQLAIPAVMELLDLQPGEYVLDLGAGNGVLAPAVAGARAHYTGVEASERLLNVGRQRHGHKGRFLLGDARRLTALAGVSEGMFDATVFLLSIQDMDPLDAVLASSAWAMRPGGRAVLLLTHPCFRMPRQSGWGWDEERKLQFRRVDRYLTPLAVPMNDGETRSFHRPLHAYINGLANCGLLVDRMQEIVTYKQSAPGPRARAENLAHAEIPLFLGLRARKVNSNKDEGRKTNARQSLLTDDLTRELSMATHPMNEPDYRCDMGDGLVLRWSTAADVEKIPPLYGYVFRNKEHDPLNSNLMNWARDMMSGRHPLIGPGDFAVVEDTNRGEIVASTCLLHQTLEYAGIPFEMGRPEIVASMPEYRNRGLVRAIFELIHARCAALNYPVQGITGIPYYYRLFGYEFALDLGGGRSVHLTDIPKLKEGTTEAYSLRTATLEDLPTVLALYERERTFKRQLPNESQSAPPLVTTSNLESYWSWMLDGQSPDVTQGWVTQLIVNADDQVVGYVLPRRMRWDEALWVTGLMVEPGVSLAAVVPSVLRALQVSIESVPINKPDTKPATRIGFDLFRAHPVYEVLGEHLAPRVERPYAWYIRVPDLPGFIRHIAPALERRLEESPLTGHTGELKINFYRGGLRLQFECGRLVAAENWSRPVWEPDAKAGFPPLVFLQLLFGHRSLADLREQLPDVWAEPEATLLLETLFPRQVSWMIPLD